MSKQLLASMAVLGGLCGASLVHAQAPETSGSGATSASSTTSAADASGDQLQEIVVTAERVSENLQKTGASVSVRKGADLTTQGRYTTQQILEDVPDVTMPVAIGGNADSDQPGANIIIRGVQPNGGAAGNSSIPTTATYTDGVYAGIGASYDIDRVEVLKGPQGTLYGRSATGGVVSTYTHDPELDKWGLDGALGVGNYDLQQTWAAVNIPIGDQFAVRVSGNRYYREGYYNGLGGVNENEDGRIKALYQPNDNLSILVAAAHEDNHQSTGNAVLEETTTPGNFFSSPETIARAQDHFDQYWATIKWNVGFATLSYTPALRTWQQNSPTVGLGPNDLTLDSETLTPSDRFWTHEVHLESVPGSFLTWQIGGLYYQNKINSISSTVVAGGPPVFATTLQKQTMDRGVFGELTYPFAPTWRLTGGVRYDQTNIDGAEDYTVSSNPFGLLPGGNTITTSTLGGPAGEFTFHNVTYKARVEKDLTDENMLYGMVSTGFLPGDVQLTTVTGPSGSAVAGAIPYAEEKLTAYEIGSKNRFLSNTLQLNGDVFYYDYSGYQTSTFTSIGNPSFAVVTSPARMWGVELDGTYLLTEVDRLGLSYSYINARYVNKTPLFALYIANDDIPNIPANTVTADYDHTFKFTGSGGALVFHGDARYYTAYYTANYLPAYATGECGPTGAQSCLPFLQAAAHVIGDLALTWNPPGGHLNLSAYVRNVGNNRYIEATTLQGFNSPTNSHGFDADVQPYDPRTVGLVLGFKF